jgi:hypothetical protein
MTVLQASRSKNSSGVTRSGRLFFLELSGDRIHSMNPDGCDRKTIVTDCRFPDGIAVDAQAGHIYWTNMGIPNLDDGSIERADLDGRNRKVIVPQGVTHTPKQLHLDKENGKLFWGDPDAIIASSSSGLTMSEIQKGAAAHPERCVIAHPFNPPHLIPLVEIVGGAKTSEDTIRCAAEFYTSIGQRTVRLNKEMPGHVANRLQAALAREVYYLVAEGVVSAADVDTALSWGPGLRWGVMGNMMLNHLGGGPGGIEHFFQQFSGPMTAWWKTLGSPVLTPEVQKRLIDSVHAEIGPRTVQELEAERDEILLGLIELRTKRPKTVAPHRVAAE